MAQKQLGQDDIRLKLIAPVTIIVLLAWVASLGVALVNNQYEALTATTPVTLIMCGYVFGLSITKKKNGDANEH